MTVPTASSRADFSGTGTTGPFPFTFRILDATHLRVTKRSVAGVETTLALTTDYTVSGAGSFSGGSVTLVVALASGEKLTLRRVVPLTQLTDLRNQTSFYAETLEDALDYVTDIAQQQQDALSRSLTVGETDGTIGALPSATLRALQALYFDAAGNPTVTGSVTSLPSSALVLVIDTIAALKALSAPSSALTYIVRGYYAAGDGGGGLFRWNSADLTADNGGTIIQLAAGGNGRWNRIYDQANLLNVRWFGAKGDGSTNDTAAFTAAITLAGSTRAIYIPAGTGTYVTSGIAQTLYANALFIGEGAISGMYRKQVFPLSTGTYDADSGVDPGMNLPRLNASAAPVVVLTGDSVATYNANGLTRQGHLTDALERAIRSQTTRPLTFYNMAISGQVWGNLASLPTTTTWPEWYTVHGNSWLSYIQALNPDVVFISFGMNDGGYGYNMNITDMNTVINAIQAWPNVPDIVLCTNLTPSLGAPGLPASATQAEQEGRDRAAGVMRSYAEYKGFGLLDFNRQELLVRDGFDPLFHLSWGSPAYTYAQTSYTCPQAVRHFSARIEFTTASFTPGSIITVPVGQNVNDVVQITNSGGNYAFQLYTGGVGGLSGGVWNYATINTAIAIASTGGGTTHLVFEKSGNKVTVYLENFNAGGNTPPIMTSKIITNGGLFTPVIAPSVGNYVTAVGWSYDSPRLSMPRISDFLLWGDGVTGLPSGGSGWNHPSANVVPFVYDPILNKTKFFSNASPGVVVGLDQYIGGDAPIQSRDTAAYGKYNFGVYFIQSATKHAAFTIPKDILFQRIILSYLTDNTGIGTYGSNCTLVVYLYSMRNGLATAATTIVLGSVGGFDKSTNDLTATLNIDSASLLSAQAGDQIVIVRVGADAQDGYGDLYLTGLKLLRK